MSLRGSVPFAKNAQGMLCDRSNLLFNGEIASAGQRRLAMTLVNCDKNRQRHCSYEWSGRCLKLAFKQMIYFFADRVQVIQTQINDSVTDISDMVQILQAVDRQITDDARGNFGLAHLLQLRLYLAQQPLDIGRGDRAFRARDPHAARQFFAVELFTGAILFDE
jgi:hypothetical protein